MATTGTIQAQFQPGIFMVAKAGAATITVGTLVYVKSFDPANGVATVEQMLANSAPTLDKLWGVVVRNMGTGGATVPIGGICQVQLAGPCQVAYTISPAPAVDDPLYVSNTGTVADVAGSTVKIIGRVGYVSGTTVHMVMDGAFGGGGGGSATAQVLLAAPDGDFPSGVDVSDLSAEVSFTDTAGILQPGIEGAPVDLYLDDGSAGANGDSVALTFSLKNNLSTKKMAGVVGARWVSATDTAEVSEAVVAVVRNGTLAEALRVGQNKLTLVDMSAGSLPVYLNSDAALGVIVEVPNGQLYHSADSLAWALYGVGEALYMGSDRNLLSNTNEITVRESRQTQRADATTTNGAPTTLLSRSFSGAATGVYAVLVTVDVAGIAQAPGTEYIFAQRKVRAVLDTTGPSWTLGPEYVPVPDDTTGSPLAVSVDTSGDAVRVRVTGIGATTIVWTAWAQILVTKVG